jgi:uncharacterized protein
MSKPWYHEGLRFKCTQCGKCCTGSPGYVWLSDDDITLLSQHLKISQKEFLHTYTRQVGHRIALLEDPKQFDCVFLIENRCQVYNARPKQCRLFPFWKDLLQSKKQWLSQKKYCEGIDHEEGTFFSLQTIQNKLKESL